jgi:ribosomal protein S27AE
MKENQQKLNESNHTENDSVVMANEKVLILSMPEPKRDLDQTISNPDRYVSWYQYKTNNIDKYLQLCPHCKKPTMSAFHRSVIDSAIDYLNGKRMFNHYPASGGNPLLIITFLAALGMAIYFLLENL